MTISRTILAVCSLICTTAYLAAAEPDNWAQSKAREALNQTATGTQPSAAAPAAKVTKPATPAPVAHPQAAPVFSTVTTAAPATQEEAQRAREALRQTLTELEAKEKAAPPTVAKSTEEIRAEKAAAGGEKKRRAAEAKAQEQTALEEKKRAAAEAKAHEADQKAAAAEAKARQAKGEKPKPTAAPKPSSDFSPLEAPPSQLPASKEDKLADLLRRYKADEITPEEYQARRAQILAEP